jgi:hypothetical protein
VVSVIESSQPKIVKPKMRVRTLRSGVNCQGALRQKKSVKQTGVKRGAGVVSNFYSLRNDTLQRFAVPLRQYTREVEYLPSFHTLL